MVETVKKRKKNSCWQMNHSSLVEAS